MVPPEYRDFMIVAVGASASFIGLLFVALSVVMPGMDLTVANRERRLAISAYVAFLNIFFLSLGAILPSHSAVATTLVVFGAGGLINSYARLKRLIISRKKESPQELRVLVPFMSLVYGFEFLIGIMAFRTHSAEIGFVVSLMIALFAIGLARAWELLGVTKSRRKRT